MSGTIERNILFFNQSSNETKQMTKENSENMFFRLPNKLSVF